MKESKFVRTKIVVGYVLIALIGLTAMIYVWRQTGALLEPDHSQQELRRRRGLVNQTLYHLYEAETYGQMLVAGYASYENRYKRELRLVRECIDSLRMRADDESQQMRLDTIVRKDKSAFKCTFILLHLTKNKPALPIFTLTYKYGTL